MFSRVRGAYEVLKKEGPIQLAKVVRWRVKRKLRKSPFMLVSKTGMGEEFIYDRSLKEVRSRMSEEETLDDILDTVLSIKPGYPPYQIRARQKRDEIESLAKFVKQEQPRSIMEIGTADGGSLYIWSRYLDNVDQIVSMDLPGGRFGGGYAEKRRIYLDSSPPGRR